MDATKAEGLVNECKNIQEHSTYTAEVHHTIGRLQSGKAFKLKWIPATVTVGAALKLVVAPPSSGGAPDWAAWVTLLAGALTLLGVIMEPEKVARDHFIAAKGFTVLKHDARATHESWRDFMGDDEFYNAVRMLRERYNRLVEISPPTDNEKAWNIARKRVKKGVHEPDFRTARS